ncbi:uncharacterized protein LOC141830404 [Curcuma longa]|uniref:uncharacterized protein LOC141830404 n=1 Tax=Curcuma longa TaxID=136217 RepID=UPI003D9F2980
MPTPASIGFAPEDARPTLRTSDRRRRKGLSCHRAGAGRKLDKQESASSPPPKAVAERLEALRNLVPPRTGGAKETAAAAATDRLFEETAEYILLLRSQVAVLKRLVAVAYMDKSDDTA